MLSDIIPYLLKHEKELAILDIVKNAEKEKNKLRIHLNGRVDDWIYDWIKKRGHKIDTNESDLGIFADSIDEEKLADYKKKFRYLAVITPANDLNALPNVLKRKITENILEDKISLNNDGKIKEIFYGLWNIAYFGFKDIKSNRFEFSAVVFFAAFFVLLVSSSYPFDDLLRHAKIHNYGYDYKNLFLYSWNFSFNPYLLFDYFVGLLDEKFDLFAVKIMQILCFLTFSLGFFWHTKNWNDKFRALIFVLVLSIIIGRITLARPTAFEAFLFIIGINLTGFPAILIGILMSSFYYLFPIYVIPLTSKRKAYIASLIIGLLLWINYAGFNYFYDIYNFILKIITNREIPIIENYSILIALADPFILIMIYLFIKSKNFTYIIPIAFFVLFNQLRFLEIIIPLMAISLDEKKIGIDNIRLGVLGNIFLLLILVYQIGNTIPTYKLENLNISNGRALCDTMTCMFNAVYTSSDISISPSMEVGLTDKEVQKQMKKIANGSLDCEFFKKYQYDFLIESNLKEISDCLELNATRGIYRIWKIKK